MRSNCSIESAKQTVTAAAAAFTKKFGAFFVCAFWDLGSACIAIGKGSQITYFIAWSGSLLVSIPFYWIPFEWIETIEIAFAEK